MVTGSFTDDAARLLIGDVDKIVTDWRRGLVTSPELLTEMVERVLRAIPSECPLCHTPLASDAVCGNQACTQGEPPSR